MCEYLGIKHFCEGCKGSKKKAGRLICNDKKGIFYGLPVESVCCAPCIKQKSTKKRTSGNA